MKRLISGRERGFAGVREKASSYWRLLSAVVEVPRDIGAVRVDIPVPFYTDRFHMVLSAVKRGEDGESLVVRFSNPTERALTGRIGCMRKITGARQLKLSEAEMEVLTVDSDNTVSLAVAPKQIVTVALRIER
jgi:hypothetical protein